MGVGWQTVLRRGQPFGWFLREPRVGEDGTRHAGGAEQGSGVGRVASDDAAARRAPGAGRAVALLAAASMLGVLTGGCSTVVGVAGGAPPVRYSAGLSGKPDTVRREVEFAAVDRDAGTLVTWTPRPAGTWQVSVRTVPVDRRSPGRSDVFDAAGPGWLRPGSRVPLTWRNGWPRRQPVGPVLAVLSPDGRSLSLSLGSRYPATFTRLRLPGDFDILMLRARVKAESTRTTGAPRR